MQCFNLNKEIDLNNKIEDLLLISIDDKLETIEDKEGIKVIGEILVSGNARTSEGVRNFSDKLDLDIFLTYDEIEERNALDVSINDFNYVINDNLLNLNIVLKVEGLKEIENTFLSEENIEFFEEEIEKEDSKRVYTSEEVKVEEEITFKEEIKEAIEEEYKEETAYTVKEVETPRTSLLKAVFSNKRIKEEVSWKLHCVKGETSYEQIAAKYNVNLNKLISINKNEELSEGKLIFLPIE